MFTSISDSIAAPTQMGHSKRNKEKNKRSVKAQLSQQISAIWQETSSRHTATLNYFKLNEFLAFLLLWVTTNTVNLMIFFSAHITRKQSLNQSETTYNAIPQQSSGASAASVRFFERKNLQFTLKYKN